MKIVQEEIFGPVGVLIKFEDEEDAIRQANDTLYGLAGAVFTQDINKALETAHRLKVGTAWINCVNTLNANVPFGGFKQSGSAYCSFSQCPPLNQFLITSDLQSVASWGSMPCTTTPTSRRCMSTWATRCKFAAVNACMYVKRTDPKNPPPPLGCLLSAPRSVCVSEVCDQYCTLPGIFLIFTPARLDTGRFENGNRSLETDQRSDGPLSEISRSEA